MTIKFLKKGIRVNGEYYPCWYSSSKYNCSRKQLGKCATVYLKTYESLPQEIQNEFAVENNTEIISDYVEKDRIRIYPGDKWFDTVENFGRKHEEKVEALEREKRRFHVGFRCRTQPSVKTN